MAMSGWQGVGDESGLNGYNGSSGGSGFNNNMFLSMGLGGLGMGLGQLFSNQKNPSDSASPYYNQIPGILQQNFGPYAQAGQNVLGQLPGIYQNMMNPNALMKQIGSGYQQSPGYQWQLGQGMNASNNAAAAGGMLGSPAHQQQAATMATGLANQDYGNYMNRALGLYGAGVGGLGNIANMGLQASQGLGQDWAQALMSQGNLAYAGQQNQNQTQGGGLGSVMGSIGAILPFIPGI